MPTSARVRTLAIASSASTRVADVCFSCTEIRFLDLRTVSVNGDEVWIVGKPPLLLHSKDGCLPALTKLQLGLVR